MSTRLANDLSQSLSLRLHACGPAPARRARPPRRAHDPGDPVRRLYAARGPDTRTGSQTYRVRVDARVPRGTLTRARARAGEKPRGLHSIEVCKITHLLYSRIATEQETQTDRECRQTLGGRPIAWGPPISQPPHTPTPTHTRTLPPAPPPK